MADRSEQVSRHELKQQKREEKLKHEAEKVKEQGKKDGFNKYLWTAVAALAVVSLGYLIYSSVANAPASPASDNTGPANFQQVHWHSYLSNVAKNSDQGFVTVCGEKQYLPIPPGNKHIGSATFHTHAPPESFIHIEGSINVNDPPKLGEFFKLIGWTFDATHLADKTNGDVCPNTGQPGKVRLVVNGKDSNLFERQPNHDGDVFQVSFE